MRDALRELLPHESAFALLLVGVWGWLVAARGPLAPLALLWLALVAAHAAVLRACVPRPTLARWRVRLGWALVLMNAVYFALGPTIRALRDGRHDALLQRIDTALFGEPLPLRFDAWSHALFSDVLSACYMLLFPYIFFSCVRHLVSARRDLATAQRFYAGFFLTYAIGFVGYIAIPAQGAWLDIPGAFHSTIAGGWLTHLNETIVRNGSTRVDVFPSLHVAASAFMLFFDRIHARTRFWFYLGPAVGLWISTIYLRYHYGIDVLAGFALAACTLYLAEHLRPRAMTPVPAPGSLPSSPASHDLPASVH